MQNSSRSLELLRCADSLQLRQLKVDSLLGHQVLVSALLHDLALVKDIDDVCVLNCAQAMRDRDCSAALCGRVEGGLYDAFGCGVEGGCGFVEEKDLGVAEEGAGDGYALALEDMLVGLREVNKQENVPGHQTVEHPLRRPAWRSHPADS